MISTRIADRYVLLAAIGSGGEARVFRARDETNGRDVAVRLALDSYARTAFPQPDFTHPHWVQLLDSGLDPQHGPYQVFELLEGCTLGKMLESGVLSGDSWRGFVDESLDAVHAVHATGQVHGDINADNFFQTEAGWKLLELPFYRLNPRAERSALFGSIYTLAPEQIDGAHPGVTTDIYSLGCLYYYAAAGRWPHSGGSVQEVAISCLTQVPPDLSPSAKALPASWCNWVMELLARRAEDRPASIAAARGMLADAVA